MGTYAELDKSRFPLVTITFTGKYPTDEGFDQYLNELEALYDAKKQLAIIFDARSAPLPSLKQQQRQASWLKKNNQLLKDYCLGTSYVITAGTTRVILKVIFSITPQPVPYKVCSNMDDAKEWALTRLSA
ncbi:STAS/SEC14 domain-containing protein [Cryomorphaceae bacterium 1068]|nr:STAS/SEC14 domain-containing protein [Cryomorphaceae bacterium 1068]